MRRVERNSSRSGRWFREWQRDGFKRHAARISRHGAPVPGARQSARRVRQDNSNVGKSISWSEPFRVYPRDMSQYRVYIFAKCDLNSSNHWYDARAADERVVNFTAYFR